MKKYLWNIKLYISMQVLFSSLCTLLLATIPYLNKLLFDFDFSKGIKSLFLLIIVYAVCIILDSVFQYISQVFEWKTSRAFRILIKKDLFCVILRMSQPQFEKYNIGDYISILGNNIQVLDTEYISGITDILRSSIMLIVYAVFLFVFVDYRIASVILIVSLLSVFIPMVTSKRLAILRKIHLQALGKYTSLLQDFLLSHNLINPFTSQTIAIEHEKILVDSENKLFQFGVFKTFKNIVNGLMMHFLSISAFAAIAYLLYKDEITIGTGVATLGYIESFIYPIRYILNDVNSIKGAKEVKQDICTFLNKTFPKYISYEKFEKNICLNDLTVNYNGFSLHRLNLVFEKGKKYAIIGHSGSGKSTIIKAIMKNVDISSGEIFIDDQNIQELDISLLISCVNQMEHLFSADFLANISIFNAYQTENAERFSSFVEQKVWESINNTENCHTLSGGEKQIVSILRSLNMNAPVLLYDESFSAIDIKTSKQLKKHIMSLIDKTIIMVTHKISKDDLKDFDVIVMVENGEIVYFGEPHSVFNLEAYIDLLD